MSRQALAIGDPDGKDPSDLPCHLLSFGQTVYRAHRADLSPWWYASDDDGRFNIPAPNGTCYLAEDQASAIREIAGDSLVGLGFIPADFAEGRVVSFLAAPGDHTLADLTHTGAANRGITREISTCVPYDIPRKWAQAIHDHGGLSDHQIDPSPRTVADVAKECGIEVVERPRKATVVAPPER